MGPYLKQEKEVFVTNSLGWDLVGITFDQN
jgi:hypothetical protein